MKSELNFLIEFKNGKRVDMHSLGLWVNSFHIYSPNSERMTIEIPNSHGARLISSRIKTRKIEIELQLETDSLKEFDDLKHEIYRLFYSDDEFKIIREIAPDKVIYAVQEGEYDIDNITDSDGEFTISLTMLDPLIYGLEKTTQLTSPFILEGNVKCRPVLKVKFSGSANEYKITQVETGKFVRVINNFVNLDELIIDFVKRKIIINGNVRMTSLSFDTNWFDFHPGENQLVITQANVSTTEIQYSPRWM